MADEHPPFPTDDERIDWDVLARYLSGESPADEARLVAEWLATRPADAALLTALDGAIARVAPARPEPSVDVEAALGRVRARRDTANVAPLRPAGPLAPGRRRRPAAWAMGGLAAAAAALLAVGVGRWRTGEGPADSRPTTAPRTLATATGQRDSLRLPDGTDVVLAPGSRLLIPAGYGGSARAVELEGAAWFQVRHDERRPFTVRAGGAIVRDVGTAFTVRTDGESGVAVAVTEGTVSLRAAAGPPRDSGLLLSAGDRGTVGAGGQVTARRGDLSEADTAWRGGRLVFRDAPLVQVRADLRRWYGIELRVADPTLARRHLTATFEAGESIGRVLDVIALAIGADLERDGATAVLRPARTTRP